MNGRELAVYMSNLLDEYGKKYPEIKDAVEIFKKAQNYYGATEQALKYTEPVINMQTICSTTEGNFNGSFSTFTK